MMGQFSTESEEKIFFSDICFVHQITIKIENNFQIGVSSPLFVLDPLMVIVFPNNGFDELLSSFFVNLLDFLKSISKSEGV